jgi:uncharacterized membrane protein
MITLSILIAVANQYLWRALYMTDEKRPKWLTKNYELMQLFVFFMSLFLIVIVIIDCIYGSTFKSL